jgi:PncC family amidohydrolase
MPGAPSEADLEAAAARLGQALLARGWQVGCAESSTAGLLAAAIADVPGSSRYFRGGVVTYASDLKISLLGVPPEVLAASGAVSAEVAEGMASAACQVLGTDLGLAVTGIAGPDGATVGKPVGLHFMAASIAGAGTMVERRIFDQDRNGNRRAAALAALELGLRAAEAR